MKPEVGATTANTVDVVVGDGAELVELVKTMRVAFTFPKDCLAATKSGEAEGAAIVELVAGVLLIVSNFVLVDVVLALRVVVVVVVGEGVGSTTPATSAMGCDQIESLFACW